MAKIKFSKQCQAQLTVKAGVDKFFAPGEDECYDVEIIAGMVREAEGYRDECYPMLEITKRSKLTGSGKKGYAQMTFTYGVK